MIDNVKDILYDILYKGSGAQLVTSPETSRQGLLLPSWPISFVAGASDQLRSGAGKDNFNKP